MAQSQKVEKVRTLFQLAQERQRDLSFCFLPVSHQTSGARREDGAGATWECSPRYVTVRLPDLLMSTYLYQDISRSGKRTVPGEHASRVSKENHLHFLLLFRPPRSLPSRCSNLQLSSGGVDYARGLERRASDGWSNLMFLREVQVMWIGLEFWRSALESLSLRRSPPDLIEVDCSFHSLILQCVHCFFFTTRNVTQRTADGSTTNKVQLDVVRLPIEKGADVNAMRTASRQRWWLPMWATTRSWAFFFAITGPYLRTPQINCFFGVEDKIDWASGDCNQNKHWA